MPLLHGHQRRQGRFHDVVAAFALPLDRDLVAIDGNFFGEGHRRNAEELSDLSRDDAGITVAAFRRADHQIELLFLDGRGQQFGGGQGVRSGHGVIENMHRRSRAHRQRVADADGHVADPHGDQESPYRRAFP